MSACSAPSTSAALETAPYVIPEQQLTLFKFYTEQGIQDGITYRNEMYRLAKRFNADDRLEAYRFACDLIGQGVPAMISVSQQQYSVWMSLRKLHLLFHQLPNFA